MSIILHPKQQHIVDIYGKLPETLDELAEAVIAVVNHQFPVVGFAWDIAYDPAVSNSHDAPLNGHTNWGGQNKNANGVRSYPGFRGRFWIRYAKDPKYGRWSDSIDKSLTYTGTGGGGPYDGPWVKLATYTHTAKYAGLPEKNDLFAVPIPSCYIYSTDYRFFLSDHPGLGIIEQIAAHNEQEDKNVVWNRTAGIPYQRKSFQLKHKFEWQDPATVANDKEFYKKFDFYNQKDPAES